MNPTVRNPRPVHEHTCAARLLGMGTLLSLLLSACTSPPTDQRQPNAGAPATGQVATVTSVGVHSSQAPNARAYRQDAARHLYLQQKDRVYKGRLPPMLYAVGVLNVDIDRQGHIQALKWTRAPRHAPEVVAEIERMVHAAAPFPAPSHLGKVTYTDVWLWDRSGRFQLDTLTEGQD